MSDSSEPSFFPPLLQDRAPHGRIYSDRALFYTAIAGGATPVILLSLANTGLLGRWRVDGWRLAVAALATGLVLPVAMDMAMSGQLPAGLARLPNGGGRLLVKYSAHLFGILIALFLWAPMMRIYNHAHSTGNNRKPWTMAITCLLAGGAIEYAALGHVGLLVYWGLL